MSNVGALLRAQYLSTFGINKAIHTKDKKEKRKTAGLLLLIVFAFGNLALVLFGYFTMMQDAYNMLEIPEASLAVACAAASVFCLIPSVYKASGVLFQFKDYDIIMPLPVKRGEIVASKLIVLYIADLVTSLFLIIPAAVAYAVKMQPSASYYILLPFLILALPALPTAIGSLIGIAFAAISRRFKKKSGINTAVTMVLTIAFLAVYMWFISSMQDMNVDKLVAIGGKMAEMIYSVYPPARFFAAGLASADYLGAAIFFFGSCAVYALFAYVCVVLFFKMRTLLASGVSGGNFKELKTEKINTPFKALYKKEVGRLFSSTIYLMNTGIGALIIVILSAAALIAGGDIITQVVGIPMLADIIAPAAALMIAGFASMSNPACVSISLEGKTFPFLKSLPLDTMTVFDAKMSLNYLLAVPSSLISSVLLAIAFKMDAAGAALCIILPLLYCVVCTEYGLIVNLAMPDFTWTNEVTVIKQSMPVFLGMILPFFFALIGIGILLLFGSAAIIAMYVFCALLAITAVILRRVLKGWGVRKFKVLS